MNIPDKFGQNPASGLGDVLLCIFYDKNGRRTSNDLRLWLKLDKAKVT